jgi:uncharacterized protein (TIGR03435 family)
MVLTDFRVKDLIMLAWHIQDFRVAGGGPWIESEHYDIEAKAEGNPTEDEFREMLRSLLAERFRLALRPETRELPIYTLVPAKNGARPGGGLVTTKEGSCTRIEDYSGPQPPPETRTPPICGFKQRLRPQTQGAPLMQLQGLGITINWLARALGTTLNRQITDETGIGGTFDFTIEYAPDDNLLPGAMPDSQSSNTTGPSLFTALQEQLGLKLESRKGPVEVFAIDHVEKPSDN